MSASSRSALLLPLVSLLAIACRTGAPPARVAAREEPVQARPEPAPGADDAGRLYLRAWMQSRRGDADGALETLRALDARGWDIPLDGRDFPGLAEREEFRAIAARIAARAPATAHAAVAIRLPERGLVAEGIAVDPRDGTLYVGSIRLRKIVRVAPGGTATDVVPAAAGGLGRVLGLKVDSRRGLLWAAANHGDAPDGGARAGSRSGVYAFDLASGAPRRAATIDGAGHLLNDLAIADDGAVIVTDSEAGAVYRLDPDAAALAPVVPAGTFAYANGIAFAEGRLLVADAFGLWDVPVAGGAPRRLAGPAGFPLGGIDGLSAVGRTLVAVQNGLGTPRIVRLELAPGAERVVRAEVLEAGNPDWHTPTTGALDRGVFHYIGNSHVDGWKEAELDPAGMVETRIHRLEITIHAGAQPHHSSRPEAADRARGFRLTSGPARGAVGASTG
ncbi:SMP-30/gluconolactonase/LRE family protein [Anaeromyxobacter terrae]|uniref:SMP-30/gluconolactonase/LRE family protein n=1 Tax=Anaeromyxobacter terrae TaxID=2925406 RepID=UPI001F56478D|nr:SMP-30/gluconolactonase/LRE family protein [Anaeromyxobacter sp. SG22]